MDQAIGKIIFAYNEVTKNLDRRSVGENDSKHETNSFDLIDFF